MPAKKKELLNYYLDKTKKDPEGNPLPAPRVGLTKWNDSLSTAINEFICFKEVDGKMHVIAKDDFSLEFKDADQVVAYLRTKYYKVQFIRSDGAMTKGEFRATIMFKAEQTTRFSGLPELIRDPNTSYIENVKLNKAKKNGSFRFLLDLISVKDTKDQYRLAAGLLSGFLPRQFDGHKPLFAVMADSQSSGKSMAVRTLARIVSDEYPIELDGISDHDISAQGGVGNMLIKYALYDNVKKPSNEVLDQLTVNVTQTYVRAWHFGVSRSRIPNNKTYFATFNMTESIDADVLNRIVSIYMKDGRTITPEKKADIVTALNGVYKNRIEVQKDISAMLIDSKIDFDNLDRQLLNKGLTVDLHSKESEWSKVMAILLHEVYPEISHFDFTISKEDRILDNATTMLEELCDDLINSHGGQYFKIPNEELFHFVQKDGAFGQFSRIGSNPIAVGLFMKNHAGALFTHRVAKAKPWRSGTKILKGWNVWVKDIESEIDLDNMPVFGNPHGPVDKSGQIVYNFDNEETEETSTVEKAVDLFEGEVVNNDQN